MKKFTFLLLVIISICKQNLYSQQKYNFDIISGKDWKGFLTYKDFSSGKDVNIPVNIRLDNIAKYDYSVTLEFPDEPQANSIYLKSFSEDGKKFGDENIVSFSVEYGGKYTMFTEKEGLDNNRPADFRFTYKYSENEFSIKKEVKYKDENDYFVRNTFNFKIE
ncbi:MAG TPA: hypothetical protein PLG90_07910 [Ignavibacteria bacterium]|nr:hypothetical protein [Ignavibacteria bacterium]